jgi:hypothetical protein
MLFSAKLNNGPVQINPLKCPIHTPCRHGSDNTFAGENAISGNRETGDALLH